MARAKRTEARREGVKRAVEQAVKAGREIRAARKRRRLRQVVLAGRVGISQAWLSDLEAGRGAGVPLEVWFSLAEALGRYLKFEFARDPLAELVDAGHVAMQELVIRVAKDAGWEVQFEAQSRAWGSQRSIDVRLIDRRNRRIVIVECWNTFGDLGAAARSSNQKLQDEEQHAVAIAGDGEPLEVGLVCVVRDTKASRQLLSTYAGVFESRLPGPSAAWVATLTTRATMPAQPGLVWCDTRATKLFARRHAARGSTGR